jgi:hypothetical protein
MNPEEIPSKEERMEVYEEEEDQYLEFIHEEEGNEPVKQWEESKVIGNEITKFQLQKIGKDLKSYYDEHQDHKVDESDILLK